ncbi:IS3 family transposase [Planococcus sp. 107-1]|uniref:IS3 family transposase n=1 Tax=Planococcus sp. 107-1 TaxID=2908840 RepID=UPI001F3BF9B5|nr:IS3 family transposase [Planococcus sp. 107-1]UJF25490.1 IS3 family transposase [Planococcus sp. 107-1]
MGSKKRFYPEEIKLEVIEMKLSGDYTNAEIMEIHQIKSVTQIKRWMQWYQKDELHRLAQGVGKQYAYEKKLSEVEELRKKVLYYEIKEELMGKVPGTGKGVEPPLFLKLVELFKEKYSITMICKCMGVPRPTYYRWRQKKFGKTELEKEIIAICEQLKFRAGHRTVKGLLKNAGILVDRKTVQRIMQKYNSQCRVKPKRAKQMTGETHLVVPNLLEQNFKADAPDQKWVTDITYLPFGESMLYLSTILDLYNNEVIAYKVSDTQNAQLVLDTLEIACRKRNTAGIILHSDQGAQYTSRAFQLMTKENGIITSMSRKGNCFDNAVIESFHSSLKSEEFYTLERVHLTNAIVQQKTEDYMYYYNYIRPFQKLNCHSPIEYRTMAA